MTLILKLDLDMVKMYLHTKNEVSMWSSSKVIAWTDRNTDRQTHRQADTQTDTQTDMTKNITYPHTWVVTSMHCSRMRTVCSSSHLCSQGLVWGGAWSQGGAWSGGCLVWGVPGLGGAWSGGGGAWSRGCLLPAGGCHPSMHWGRSPLWTEWQTGVKT